MSMRESDSTDMRRTVAIRHGIRLCRLDHDPHGSRTVLRDPEGFHPGMVQSFGDTGRTDMGMGDIKDIA